MCQTAERNLELTPRTVGTRERPLIHTIQFELDTIVNRFSNNLDAIKAQFNLVEQLKINNDSQYEDVLRSQIVFLESAFDFFMHEITKYGMMQIFQRIWAKTDKYNNFKLRLGDISDVLQNPEQENWFLDIVNDSYAEDTFMSSDAVTTQLNLIGVNWKNVADRAFYEQGSTVPTREKFKTVLDSLYKRRNQIAHQADCSHETGIRMNIERKTVENYIRDIADIVNSIQDEIQEVNNA